MFIAFLKTLKFIGRHHRVYGSLLEKGLWISGNSAIRGPYVAVLEGAATNTSVPSIDELRMRIRQGMQREKEWRPLLERNATTNDIPELLKILRKECTPRTGKGGHYGYVSPNSVTEMACKHLVSLHDVSALTNALNINQNLSFFLGGGFDSARWAAIYLVKDYRRNRFHRRKNQMGGDFAIGW